MFRKYRCSRKELVIQRLVSLLDVSLQIRKEVFYRKSLVLLVSSKDFKPK